MVSNFFLEFPGKGRDRFKIWLSHEPRRVAIALEAMGVYETTVTENADGSVTERYASDLQAQEWLFNYRLQHPIAEDEYELD